MATARLPQATFVGRKKGAIGIFYPITTTVEGDNVEQATLNLYERFEHVHKLQIGLTREEWNAGPGNSKVTQ